MSQNNTTNSEEPLRVENGCCNSRASIYQEFLWQKKILSDEESSTVEEYGMSPFQIPSYAAYLKGAMFCTAGQNSINRLFNAMENCNDTISSPIELDREIHLGNVRVCTQYNNIIDMKIMSRKTVILEFKVPCCEKLLSIPFCVFEDEEYTNYPLRLGRIFDQILREFRETNEDVSLPICGMELISQEKTFALSRVEIPNCGFALDLDPYPRNSVFSRKIEGKLIKSVTLDEIQEYLESGIVYVEFSKLAGDERKMYCTKSNNFIPQSKKPVNVNPNRYDRTAIRVFDVDLCEWRSFKLESVVKIWIKRSPYQSGPDMRYVLSRKISNFRKPQDRRQT